MTATLPISARIAVLFALSGAVLLTGCASGPDTPDEGRNAVVADPPIGSNIPRRERKPASTGTDNTSAPAATK